MARDSDRVLRIGLVLRGKIVEERILRRPAAVTIGRSHRCTLAVPQSDLPESFELFPHGGAGYSLCFDDRMDGRISSPQGSLDFEQLIHFGAAKKKGQIHAVPLEADQWGRVALGEATVLFQFVVPPPDAPRPRLPAVVRGNRFRSMDGLFVSVLAVSLLVHVSAYAGLSTIPVREEVTLEEIPDRFAKLLIPERKPEPVKQEAKQEVVDEKKEEKKPEKKPGDDSPQNKAERAAAVAKAVQQKGILRVLGALGPGGAGKGAVADVFGQGGFGDVASALSGAGGVAVATDGAGAGGRKGGGGGGAATIGDLGTSGGGKVGLGAKSEVRVSGSVGVEDAEIDSPDIDQQKLSGFVRARMAAIKACYENQLKRNPNLKGKIRIRFTILETGSLSDVTAVENTLGSTEVAACIVGTMRTWRTPFRPAGTVPVDYPFVFSAN